MLPIRKGTREVKCRVGLRNMCLKADRKLYETTT